MNSLLTPIMLCREMSRLTLHLLNVAHIEFVPTPPNVWLGAFKDCTQKHIDFLIDPSDFVQSIDDFSANFLLPCAKALAKHLKADGIQYSYELFMPKGQTCARCNFDGLNMRLIVQPRTDGGLIPALEGENPDSYLLRFDVLFSHLLVDLSRQAA